MDGFPDNCVIHMLPDSVLTYEEFKENHSFDKDELSVPHSGKIHNLKGDSIVMVGDEATVQTVVDLETFERKIKTDKEK